MEVRQLSAAAPFLEETSLCSIAQSTPAPRLAALTQADGALPVPLDDPASQPSPLDTLVHGVWL